ncbi:hypothetical protein C8R46DRAFT_1244561 [Mycena filopes]|nr:hypothetical protein C8R46DRAFT_1244561 [Mycena filopes]
MSPPPSSFLLVVSGPKVLNMVLAVYWRHRETPMVDPGAAPVAAKAAILFDTTLSAALSQFPCLQWTLLRNIRNAYPIPLLRLLIAVSSVMALLPTYVFTRAAGQLVSLLAERLYNRSCHISTLHTAAYVFDDAQHLLVRVRARQFGHAVPHASAVAPLRFAPPPVARPEGPIQCCEPGCTTRGGTPRQAAQKCIELKCRPCCIDAAASAVQSGAYRDYCKAHSVNGNAGPPAAPAGVPLPLPPPLHAQPGPGYFAPQAPVQLAPPHLQYPPYRFDPGGNVVPVNPAPLPPQPQPEAQDLVDTGKIARQRLDVNHTADLIVFHTKGANPLQLQLPAPSFPQMQLSAHPALLQSLEIADAAWIDLYTNPGLLVEFRMEDCPGLNEIISQQSRKRVGSALVSPPKKIARTDAAVAAPAAQGHVVEPPSPTTPSSVALPSPAHPPASSTVLTRPALVGKKFPHSFFAVEHQEGWGYYDQLQDSGTKTSIAKAWPNLFPGSDYFKTTVTAYRGMWVKAPDEIKAYFASLGCTPEGSWAAFAAACKADTAGQPWRPEPLTVQVAEPTALLSVSAPVGALKPASAPAAEQLSIPAVAERLSIPPVDPPAPFSFDSSDTILPGQLGLCSFCDTPFTVALSAKSVGHLEKLIPTSTVSPTSVNPNHRVASLSHQANLFCKQHRTDSLLLPQARENHWPEHINYAELSERTENVAMIPLQEILEDLDASDFFSAATTTPARFKKLTAYFGELGYAVISRTIQTLFPAATIADKSALLPWELTEQVLIPEALSCLIVDELQVPVEEALDIIADSTPFGLEYHSDVSDRERCVAKLREEVATTSLPLTPFPMSSPLPSPSPPSSSPTVLLAPAVWEDDRHKSTPPPDPLTLCNFCDQVFPLNPSDSLVALGKKLRNMSWPDSLPENLHHRRGLSIQKTANYCAQHRFEQQHMPRAIFEGWPLKPHFKSFFHRILDLGQPLRNLFQVPGQSTFFTSAIEHYGNQVTHRSSIGSQYSDNRSSQHGAGYYGERGYQLLDPTIRFMFPDSPDLLTKFHPLTYDIIIREVLIPEAAIRLVASDLGIATKDAVAVLHESYSFGIGFHPADDDCPFYLAAMQTMAKSHRRAGWSLRTWEASGSSLGFEAWLSNQREMEEALAVKSEPREQRLSWKGCNEVIDLTGDD